MYSIAYSFVSSMGHSLDVKSSTFHYYSYSNALSTPYCTQLQKLRGIKLLSVKWHCLNLESWLTLEMSLYLFIH